VSLVAFRVFTSFDVFRRDVASADAHDWLFDVREHTRMSPSSVTKLTVRRADSV